ncbi:MAG TPA: hydantoinase/oxoprolinase family protein [Solirubrobacterales bacterium]|nr:hydantoinase/oxoprolinase family protein [Solirubrobacterales bacterium]
MLLGVDVGGTFTDAVLVDGGRVATAKAPTTPDDQSVGVAAAVAAVLDAAGTDSDAVRRFAHGMTVGTNALLERRGARTALVATEGFTDLLEIARQNRPSLYRLCEDRPPPLAPPELRVAVRERAGADGVVVVFDEEEIERVGDEIERLDPEAVAICLLFSFAFPEHEQRLAAALRQRFPDLHISVSFEVLPRFREYERCATTTLDAYLAPLLGGYLRRLGDRCREIGIPEPLVMQSSGGITDADRAARGGAWSVLSGPAGGAVGAGLLAAASGEGDALGLDMGGTSCDVCVVESGRVGRTETREFAGRPIQLPMVDVHTVGAGGGSIAWRDRGGALRVGPRSAGAEPGPACYGRGGAEPTVTDANLLLGYLDPEGGLAGGIRLDRDASAGAIAALAESLGLDPLATAAGIRAVANQEMVRALRVITVERGIDPRRFDLLAFGGAGPLHAIAIAAELGIGRVVCPRSGGVLSALGLVCAERRRDTTRTVNLAGAELSAAGVSRAVEETLAGLDRDRGAALEAIYELRYAGQAFELPVDGPLDPDPEGLIEDFAAEHERRYGYRGDDGAVELVNIRIAAREPIADFELPAGGGDVPRRSTRTAHLPAGAEPLTVLGGEPQPGFASAGPCVFELPETTFLVPSGWCAAVDRHGSIVATPEEAG